MEWRAGIWATRLGKPAIVALLALALLALVFLLGRCTGRDDDTAQVEQTNRSGDAISHAAQDAIATIGDRTATEDAIDKAAEQVATQIGQAQSADEIRDAVLMGVCQQNSHRNDPACMPSAENHQ